MRPRPSRRRHSTRTSTGGVKPQLRDTRPTAAKGRTRDAVAERVGLGSGRNYQRGAQIVEAADEMIKGGKVEAGNTLLRIMEQKSIAAAGRVLRVKDAAQREKLLLDVADRDNDHPGRLLTELRWHEHYLPKAASGKRSQRPRPAYGELPPLPPIYRTIVVGPLDLPESETDRAGSEDSITFEDLARLPISDWLSEKGGYLYFWSTNYMLPQVLRFVEEWGFRFQTLLTWMKASTSESRYYPSSRTTPYFRSVTEHLVFAVRGAETSNMLLQAKHPNAVITPPPERPTETRPGKIYEFIELNTPGPYLELFGRWFPTEKWTRWDAPRSELLRFLEEHEAQSG